MNIEDCNDLAYLIEEKVQGCTINWYSVIAGDVAGKIDGSEFSITFTRGSYLSLSVADSSGIINIMQPLLTAFMGLEPVCSYDIVSSDGKLSVMEWDLINPIDHIERLINLNPFDDSKVINLHILSDKKV